MTALIYKRLYPGALLAESWYEASVFEVLILRYSGPYVILQVAYDIRMYCALVDPLNSLQYIDNIVRT